MITHSIKVALAHIDNETVYPHELKPQELQGMLHAENRNKACFLRLKKKDGVIYLKVSHKKSPPENLYGLNAASLLGFCATKWSQAHLLDNEDRAALKQLTDVLYQTGSSLHTEHIRDCVDALVTTMIANPTKVALTSGDPLVRLKATVKMVRFHLGLNTSDPVAPELLEARLQLATELYVELNGNDPSFEPTPERCNQELASTLLLLQKFADPSFKGSRESLDILKRIRSTFENWNAPRSLWHEWRHLILDLRKLVTQVELKLQEDTQSDTPDSAGSHSDSDNSFETSPVLYVNNNISSESSAEFSHVQYV